MDKRICWGVKIANSLSIKEKLGLTNEALSYYENRMLGFAISEGVPEPDTLFCAAAAAKISELFYNTTIDVFTELQDSIAEAFYTAIDKAAFFGKESPFATSILGGIDSVGAEVVDNSSVNLDLSASDVMAMVEDAGYEVDGWAASIGLKNRLRKLRDSNGSPIYVDGTDQTELYNQPTRNAKKVRGQRITRSIINHVDRP